MKTNMRALTTAAIVAAATGLSVSAGHAFGNAPWCAVINVGVGDMEWDCEYQTVEQCVPNVLAGNRGFCNLNPYWHSAPASAVIHVRHHKPAHRS
jgi:hypothetical protein